MRINNNPYMSTLIDSLGSSSRTDRTEESARQAVTQQNLLAAASSAQVNQVAFSALGVQLNDTFRAAKATGDPGIMAGFQAAMGQTLGGSDPLQVVRFVQGAANLAGADPATFSSVFSTINDLKSQGLGTAVGTFMDTTGKVFDKYGQDGVQSLTSSVDSVLQSDYASSKVKPADNLASLFSTFRQFLQEPYSASTATQFFQDLGNGLGAATSGDQVAEFLNSVELPPIA